MEIKLSFNKETTDLIERFLAGIDSIAATSSDGTAAAAASSDGKSTDKPAKKVTATDCKKIRKQVKDATAAGVSLEAIKTIMKDSYGTEVLEEMPQANRDEFIAEIAKLMEGQPTDDDSGL